MILRPYACVIAGELHWGVEVEVESGVITALRPIRGVPDPYVLVPAFVNAHSHFEYRLMAGRIERGDFARFIRQITELKRQEGIEDVQQACQIAATENRRGGVGWVAEHSDRPGSARAMRDIGLRGRIYQEVITLGPVECIAERWESTREKFAEQSDLDVPMALNPHAIYTVDEASLRVLAESKFPLSLHLAESRYERMLTEQGDGPFADFWVQIGWPTPVGESPVEYASRLGLLRSGNQIVHACDVTNEDIEVLAESGVSVAHCPRSNEFLACPPAPIRRMVEAGIPLGIGTDSAASGGIPDMFAEMRAALDTSERRGEGLSGEQVLNMATTGGAESLGLEGWGIEVGSQVPLVRIEIPGVESAEELIQRGSPQDVAWCKTSD